MLPQATQPFLFVTMTACGILLLWNLQYVSYRIFNKAKPTHFGWYSIIIIIIVNFKGKTGKKQSFCKVQELHNGFITQKM